jgi:voltage-gated potassium channel
MKHLRIFKGLLTPVLMLALLTIVATLAYMYLEGFKFLDALYMTIITVGSVGFQEVHPLSDAGRLFTICLIMVNIAIFTYFITLLSRYFFDLDFVKRYKLMTMENKIQQLKDHVIICGFGRNGRESAQVLQENKIPYVVLEEKQAPEADADVQIPYYLIGDATRDEVLIEAGIKNARAIITTLPVDADNLFVVLSAKQLNPKITVISRASQDSSVNKLKIAGANNVIMPDKIGGAHMATLVLQPDVVELLSLMSTRSNSDFRIAEIKTGQQCILGDLDLWNKTNCTILGIKNKENNYDLNPPANYSLSVGESLIVMGSDEQISLATSLVK